MGAQSNYSILIVFASHRGISNNGYYSIYKLNLKALFIGTSSLICYCHAAFRSTDEVGCRRSRLAVAPADTGITQSATDRNLGFGICLTFTESIFGLFEVDRNLVGNREIRNHDTVAATTDGEGIHVVTGGSINTWPYSILLAGADKRINGMSWSNISGITYG